MGVGTGTGSYWYRRSQYQLQATESKSVSPPGHMAAEEPQAPLCRLDPRTHTFLRPLEGVGCPACLGRLCSGLGGWKACPLGSGCPGPPQVCWVGAAGPRVLPTAPGRGFLGIWDPGGGQLAGPGRGRSPDRHKASPRRGSGLDPGVAIRPSTSWPAQVTQIQRSGVHRKVLREADGPSP